MVDIGKVTVGNQTYYTDQVVDGVEDYYSMKGESPGLYFGSLTPRLVAEAKLGKFVETEDFQTLLSGRDPESVELLGSTMGRRGVLGVDIVFRAPKSVSLMYAIGDRYVSEQVELAHDAAVKATLEFMEPILSFTRSGAGGAVKEEGAGLAGVAFKHRTSREMDPLLHTHAVCFNFTKRLSDGMFRSLDGTRFFPWAKVMSFVYRSHLRATLSRELGVGWTPVENGISEVEGISREMIERFSKRSKEIQHELEKRGESSPRARAIAARTTRRAKEDAPADLKEYWLEEAREVGLTPQSINDLCAPAAQLALPEPIDFDGIAGELLGPGGLTANQATFDIRDVICATFDLVEPSTDPEVVLDFAKRFLAEQCVVLDEDLAVDFVEGSWKFRCTGDEVYSTPKMIKTELTAHERFIVHNLRGWSVDYGEIDVAESGLGIFGQLNACQSLMLRSIVRSPSGIDLVVGDAGTGKTFALSALRQAYESNGVQVLGLAPAHTAVEELWRGAGIRSATVQSFVKHREFRAADGSLAPPRAPRRVIVVDEASMIDTEDMLGLLDVAGEMNAKVVLVGDYKQLNSVAAGGAFKFFAERNRVSHLDENMRQRDLIDREIAAKLDKEPDGAFALAVANDRIRISDDVRDAELDLYKDWMNAVYDGYSTLILAARNADVDRLNRDCQRHMMRRRQFSGDPLGFGGESFYVGDPVVFRENNRQLGVTNRMSGKVVEVDTDRGELTVEIDGIERTVVVSEASLQSHQGLRLGYASTVHSAQGRTVDKCFTLFTSQFTKEHTTVALTRHRESWRFYATTDSVENLAGYSPGLEEDAWADLRRPFSREDRQRMAIDRSLGVQVAEEDAELAARLDEKKRSLVEDPPDYLVEKLGRPEEFGHLREEWMNLALRMYLTHTGEIGNHGEHKIGSGDDTGAKKDDLDEDVSRLRKSRGLDPPDPPDQPDPPEVPQIKLRGPSLGM